MSKPSFTDRHTATDKAFRAIVDAEQAKRAATMARLRAARLNEPAPAEQPAKVKKTKR
jgi:hypothetical protein